MRAYSLYELTFPNGKRYLGISADAEKRWRQQKSAARRSRQDWPLYRAIRKYGENNVRRRVLVKGSLAYVRAMEIAAIQAFQTQVPRGYNVALGGQISPSAVPEVRKKMSEGQLRVWSNPEYKEMMREKARQRKRSPDHCANLARAKKREWENPEARSKYVKAHLGKTQSEETKRKKSASLKGHPNWNHRKMLIDEKGRFVRAMTDEEIATLTHVTESA